MTKPIFNFFKMLGCGHCVSFYSKPSLEKSVWAQLNKDPELKSKVEFRMYEWGRQKQSNGELVYNKLPDEYSFVNYGPYFYLQNPTDPTVGFEMRTPNRSFETIKAWILQHVRSKPELVTASQRRPRQMSTSSSSKTEQIRLATQTNWGNRRQLPPHVQKRLQRRKGTVVEDYDEQPVQMGQPGVATQLPDYQVHEQPARVKNNLDKLFKRSPVATVDRKYKNGSNRSGAIMNRPQHTQSNKKFIFRNK